MISAYTRPVLVPANGDEVLLARIPLSGAESKQAYDENWLQDLVYRHPSSLPVGDIDDSFSGMVPLCREMVTPAGPVDVVYVTRDGRPVILEAKLWRNPEARRKVIGQILDYAKELSQWDVGKFDAAVRQARRGEDHGEPRGLLEVLGIAKESPEAARFHDALTRNLKRGEILLLIVGDGIREGAGAIAEFLEGHASLHFTFGLIELAIYGLPDGGRLVQPRILAQSDIVRRIVVDLREGGVRDDEGAASEEEGDAGGPPDGSREELRRQFNAFWTAFLTELRLDNANQRISAPSRSPNQYFMMPKASGAWVSAYVAPSKSNAGVFLTFPRGPIGDRLYATLEADRSTVERELGVPVHWKSDGQKHYISTFTAFGGSLLVEHAVEVRRALADWTNRYVNVFRPRIEKLTREIG
jgi:hypothetical protein